MKAISNVVIGAAPSLPDGKTVTPINDVALLQQCAGLQPTYTTLSEIFADTGALEAIINSNNAIDYLKRSTKFAVAQPLVPTMTSDTTPSGECFGSSYDNAYYLAFDNSQSTRWNCTDSATLPQYVGYDFKTPTLCKKAIITQPSSGGSAYYVSVSNCKIQGYDGTNWIDIKTGITLNWGETQVVDFSTNETKYEKYNLLVPAYNVSSSTTHNISIYTLQFVSENGFTDNATAMSYIGLNNYAANTLLGDTTWCNAICNSTYFESVLNAKVPVMTSNNTPSGECFASSVYSGYPAWKAFNGGSGDWISANGQYANSYIGYGFTKNTKVYMARITQGHMSRAPKNYKLQAFDGTNWIDVTETLNPFNGTETPNTVFNQFTKNIGSYPRYRLFISTIQTTSENIASVRVLQFYGREDV